MSYDGKNISGKLQASEIKYRAIFEQAADSIIIIDPETGELVLFNNKSYESLGYTHEEFEKIKIPDLEVIESPEEVKKHIEKVLRDGDDVFETKHRTKDGKIRDILVTYKVISIHGKKYIQSLFRDITDIKKTERQSKESKEKLSYVKNNISIILGFVFSALYLLIEGLLDNYIFFNTEFLFQDIFTTDPHEILVHLIPISLMVFAGIFSQYLINAQRRAEDKLKEAQRDLMERVKEITCLYELTKLIEKPEISQEAILLGTLDLIPPAWQFPEITCARINFDNTEFKTNNFKETEWKLSSSVIVNEKLMEIEVYYFEDKPFLEEERSLIYDIGYRLKVIIEKKEAKQKLKDSKQKFKVLFNSVNDAIFIISTSGRFIEVNKTACERLGYSKEEFLKMTPNDIAPQELRSVLEKGIKKTLGNGHAFIETIHQTKTGREIPTEVNTRKIKYDGNWAIIGVARDITKRKRAETLLKESEAKYREAFDRTNFYKDILTHDMNNILQVIQLSLEISLMDEKISKKSKESLDSIQNQVIRGSKLISNVQKLTQLEESQLHNIDIYKVLMDSLNFLQLSFPKKKINVKVETPRKSYLVKANKIIREIFENILINAVNYNQNSAVEILIRFSEKQKDDNNFIKIEFMDNGRGIPDSIKKIIFHKGFLEEKQSTGMGIGLTLVKKAIETYNGQIWVEDKIIGDYTKGSNVIIMIPEVV